MKAKKEVYRICGKEVSKSVWDKNLQYTIPTKKAKGIPCSNMREFDAVMEGKYELKDCKELDHADCGHPDVYQDQHTPTPQQQLQDLESEYGTTYIVRAVNAHEEMLSALKELMKRATNGNFAWGNVNQILSAIAKADGK